jgi:hypothetical protein
MIKLIIFCLLSFVSFLAMAQTPTKEQIEAEVMRLMTTNPELAAEPEKLLEKAKQNLGLKTAKIAETTNTKISQNTPNTKSTNMELAGKVVFSETSIAATADDKNLITSVNSLSKPLYGRFFSKLTAFKTWSTQQVELSDGGTYEIWFSKDGKVLAKDEQALTDAQVNNETSYSFTLIPPSTENKSNYSTASVFLKLVKALGAGTHNVKVEAFYSSYKGEISVASNILVLTLSAADIANFDKNFFVQTSAPVYSNSGSSSGGMQIYLDNKTNKSGAMEIIRNGSRVSSNTLNTGKSSGISVLKGDVIKVNGKVYHTVTDASNQQTIVIN